MHWNSWAASVRQFFPDKPFVIAETGAGGIYEWSDNSTAATWTTKYQAEVIAADLDAVLELMNGHLSGITLFQFMDIHVGDDKTRGTPDHAACGPCDYLPGVEPPTCGFIHAGPLDDDTYPYPNPRHTCGRPGGLNHKGVLDPWRRPKEAFRVVATKFNATLDPLKSDDGPGEDAAAAVSGQLV